MIHVHVLQITMTILVLKPVNNVIIDVIHAHLIIMYVILALMKLEKALLTVYVKIITLI